MEPSKACPSEFDSDGYPILTKISDTEYGWGEYRFIRNGQGRFDEYHKGEFIIGGSVGYSDLESIQQRIHDVRASIARHDAWGKSEMVEYQ